MKLTVFDEFTRVTARRRETDARLTEWLAGVVRQSTGWTLADLNDGCNSVRLDLVLDPKVLTHLAEHERDSKRLNELGAA